MQALSLEVWDRAKPVRSKNGASAFFVHVSDDYEYSYTYLALLPKIMFIFFPRLLPIMTKRKFLDLKVKQGKGVIWLFLKAALSLTTAIDSFRRDLYFIDLNFDRFIYKFDQITPFPCFVHTPKTGMGPEPTR